MNVSSIIKKGIGYEIELSKTYRILNLFSFISRKTYFCAEHGCVDCKNYRPIRDKKIAKILRLAYHNKKKQDNV